MSKILAKISPVAKAIAAAVVGAVVPLLIVGFTNGFDWKAIVAAAGTAALSALSVFIVPNGTARKTTARKR
jgi:uncharacterized membrane protein